MHLDTIRAPVGLIVALTATCADCGEPCPADQVMCRDCARK